MTGKMKLWLLRPADALPKEDSPWIPPYEKAFGFVIRARDEQEARAIADDDDELENYEWEGRRPWLDPKYSSCAELTARGESGVVIRDFNAG